MDTGTLDSPARFKSINSPFRYPGGKYFARNLILPEILPHSAYAEVFAGGASIFFAKTKAAHTILNDIDKGLATTLTWIRDNPEPLISRLQELENTKEMHTYYASEYQPDTELDIAVKWYFLNKTSFSGIVASNNCYWSSQPSNSMHPESWGTPIRQASRKLQGVEIKSLDFEEFIDTVETDFFLFVDPPYYHANKRLYEHSFEIEDHVRLAECLKRNSNRINFLVTYDNSVEVKELYDWAEDILEREWTYMLSRTDDQRKDKFPRSPEEEGRKKVTEIFIKNYPFWWGAQ